MNLPVLFAVAALALAASTPAHALFMTPTPAPVDRIVKNTEAMLAKTPENLELRYQLARVHYLAFALKKAELGVHPSQVEVAPPTANMVSAKHFQNSGDKKGPTLDGSAALKHAVRGAELFQEVLKKEPNHMLAHLGLGSLLEQFAAEVGKELPKEIPAVLAKHDRATIRQHYAAAFKEAWKKERVEKFRHADGLDSFVSYEAAESYLRNAKGDAGKLQDEEKENVRSMTEAVKQLESLPRGDVTPLVFSVKPNASINALLAPEIAVDFDLRGFGFKERWPWVQPETGVLVWDPAREGKITSARQMFGSYSWQLFWRDGFAALAALDDSQDGWLRGAELDGISVWFDRNQNAASDAGEVMPVEWLKVTGLACSAPEAEGRHPMHRHGVEFQDGRNVPLWDWVTGPLAPAPQEVAKR